MESIRVFPSNCILFFVLSMLCFTVFGGKYEMSNLPNILSKYASLVPQSYMNDFSHNVGESQQEFEPFNASSITKSRLYDSPYTRIYKFSDTDTVMKLFQYYHSHFCTKGQLVEGAIIFTETHGVSTYDVNTLVCGYLVGEAIEKDDPMLNPFGIHTEHTIPTDKRQEVMGALAHTKEHFCVQYATTIEGSGYYFAPGSPYSEVTDFITHIRACSWDSPSEGTSIRN